MKRAQRYKGFIDHFSVAMPAPQPELHYGNVWELLVAVVLSAQCTDKRVNIVTPALFEAFPTPAAMAGATVEQVYEKIRSISYPNAKAAHLLSASRRIVEVYGGQVPGNRADLESLAGVGRKTANVILAVGFGVPAMPVDTHVFRVANRIGLTNARDVIDSEWQLTKNFPEDMLCNAHHWLILHGRYTCTARNPHCRECPISDYCKYYEKMVRL